MVTMRSFIACSSAACVFGGVRLISSASSSLGEDRPLGQHEAVGLEVEEVGAEDVAGHQVGRELDAAELQRQGRREGLGQQGLGGARHALEQEMAADTDRLVSIRSTTPS